MIHYVYIKVHEFECIIFYTYIDEMWCHMWSRGRNVCICISIFFFNVYIYICILNYINAITSFLLPKNPTPPPGDVRNVSPRCFFGRVLLYRRGSTKFSLRGKLASFTAWNLRNQQHVRKTSGEQSTDCRQTSTRWCPPSCKLGYNPNNYRYISHKL